MTVPEPRSDPQPMRPPDREDLNWPEQAILGTTAAVFLGGSPFVMTLGI